MEDDQKGQCRNLTHPECTERENVIYGHQPGLYLEARNTLRFNGN